MFDEASLKELASIQAGGPVLSVYLNVDPTQRTAEEYKLHLREMLKQVNGNVDTADVDAVRHYVDLEYDWSGRGLVLFSRRAEDIWYAFPLAIPVRSGVVTALKPYISPLVELDGIYGRYTVAVIDRQGGRFYHFAMGELIAQDTVEGEDVRHTRRGRGSSVVGMRGGAPLSGRKEAEVVQRNFRDLIGALTESCQQHRTRRILLAGAERTVAQFREYLPQNLAELVIGSFAADIDSGEVEIRERAEAILRELSVARQKELTTAVITATAKGMNGVLGLDATLSVANEGRIQVLVVERDYQQPGYRCNGCGYLTTQQLEQCVFCSADFTEIPDAVEAVISQVVDKGGSVEVVENHTVAEAHIGALLRY